MVEKRKGCVPCGTHPFLFYGVGGGLFHHHFLAHYDVDPFLEAYGGCAGHYVGHCGNAAGHRVDLHLAVVGVGSDHDLTLTAGDVERGGLLGYVLYAGDDVVGDLNALLVKNGERVGDPPGREISDTQNFYIAFGGISQNSQNGTEF